MIIKGLDLVQHYKLGDLFLLDISIAEFNIHDLLHLYNSNLSKIPL